MVLKNESEHIIIITIITIIIIIIIMKLHIAHYPQLQLGHNALTQTRYDQNNKAPKIKKRTHTTKNIPRALYIT